MGDTVEVVEGSAEARVGIAEGDIVEVMEHIAEVVDGSAEVEENILVGPLRVIDLEVEMGLT